MRRIISYMLAGFLTVFALTGCQTRPIPGVAVGRRSGPLTLRHPTALAINPRGGFLVTDTGHNRVLLMSRKGRIRAVWGSAGRALGQFRRPLGLAINAARSLVYVADYLNDRIEIFSLGGHPVGQWKLGGKRHFAGPVDVAVGHHGNVYVVEFNACRVVKFNPAGHRLVAWGRKGHHRDDLYYPTHIMVGPNRGIWVSDSYNSLIKEYNPHGKLIHVIGGWGAAPGQFDVVDGLAFADGYLWATDFFNSRLQRIAIQSPAPASAAMIWTGSGTPTGALLHPVDIVFSTARRLFYVVDFGHNRILRLRLVNRSAKAPALALAGVIR